MTPSAVQDFSIHVSDEVLEDLHDRLVRTRCLAYALNATPVGSAS